VPFAVPSAPYAVLHVGASTPLKRWPVARWRELADALAARGCTIAWSAGPREGAILDEIGPKPSEAVYAGSLDLAQLWHLIEGARVLVAPDTGVAHLGRVIATPTVTIFGPGSSVICGNGRFWRDMPWRAVTREDFPCRDQDVLFRRRLDWVRRCGRSTAECERPLCMEAVATDEVLDAVEKLSIAM
jgi:ADP-heptose:LPS heptosyltransferase